MADQTAQIREAIHTLLKGKKSLTEREVKAAVAKTLKMRSDVIGAGIIRDVRKKLGIDRPSAIAFARSLLAKDTAMEARKIINAVGDRFGIRLGPPDVSRLRPTKARVGRGAHRKPGRPPKSAVKPAAAPTPAPKPAPAPLAAKPAKRAKRAKRGRPAAKRGRPAGVKGNKKRSISMRFQGSGEPEALAAFFLSLGHSLGQET